MDTYQKMETVQAEQWNKLGDVKEAGVRFSKRNDFRMRSGPLRLRSFRIVQPGDYIVKAYDIQTDSTVYYPVPKEDFESNWSKVSKPEWEGDGDAYVPA